jgi:hypothetical protein
MFVSFKLLEEQLAFQINKVALHCMLAIGLRGQIINLRCRIGSDLI